MATAITIPMKHMNKTNDSLCAVFRDESQAGKHRVSSASRDRPDAPVTAVSAHAHVRSERLP
jgi:hypothetical protein